MALALAGLHDPERPGGGRCLPGAVTLTDLVAGPIDDVEALRAHWRSAGDDPPLRTRLAMAADGPVEIDLVRDGPHMLVAGTTGAGKSELLRTLIAGLAAGAGPEHLAFVLIDYKGGGAFDACAACLTSPGWRRISTTAWPSGRCAACAAELRRREAMLRDAGAPDLSSYRSVRGRPPIPRLVVVVDEFATLAADLPGFIPSLVAVAQRGRSLGVHLVLATQRPAGAVSDDIRANTTLRRPAGAGSCRLRRRRRGHGRRRSPAPPSGAGRHPVRTGRARPVQVASVSLPVTQAPSQAVTVDEGSRAPMGSAALRGRGGRDL